MLFNEDIPLDEELTQSMNAVYEFIKASPHNIDTEDQLRMRIVGHNLRALSQIMLIADERPDVFGVNIKQICLGLLGTAAWLEDKLPSLDPEIKRTFNSSS